MNVLICDDEKLIVEDLARDVEKLFPNASVDAVTSGKQALALAKEKEYDVAILDIDLPDLDGLSIAKQLIATQPVINIMFATGHQEYALEAHKLYCSAFLLKPIGQRKLKEAFGNLRKPFLDISPEFYAHYYSGENLIGQRIEKYRELRGISRQELADLMDVTRQTIFRWEQGERLPDVLTFVKLARILGVDIKDIITSEL